MSATARQLYDIKEERKTQSARERHRSAEQAAGGLLAVLWNRFHHIQTKDNTIIMRDGVILARLKDTGKIVLQGSTPMTLDYNRQCYGCLCKKMMCLIKFLPCLFMTFKPVSLNYTHFYETCKNKSMHFLPLLVRGI